MNFKPIAHYNIEIEKAILGACLIEKQAIGRVYSILQPENFYNSFHQTVYQTMLEMYTTGHPIDLLTVTDNIVRQQGKEKFGVQYVDHFVMRLTNFVVSSTNIEYHSFIIKTLWMEREIIKLTTGGANLEGDARKKISDLQDRLRTMQEQAQSHDWQDMTSLMVSMYQHQDEMRKTGGIGLKTGIKEIDRVNGGFHNGQLIVIGARPSVGKSAFVGSIALAMAENKQTVGIVSLEMSNTEIAARLAAIDTDTDFQVLYRGLYQDEAQTLSVYKRIASNTSSLPIYITDKTNVSITEIRAKADKLKAAHGLSCLVIDYLQLIDTPETYSRTRENEISKISRYCKVMAKEMNIPVILLVQLNRDITKRTYEHRLPVLSDIRESGSIEQDADVVLFLHRDWMSGFQQDPDGNSTECQADLVVRKWRNGSNNFVIAMDFDGPKMLFTPRDQYTHKINVDYQDDNPF